MNKSAVSLPNTSGQRNNVSPTVYKANFKISDSSAWSVLSFLYFLIRKQIPSIKDLQNKAITKDLEEFPVFST